MDINKGYGSKITWISKNGEKSYAEIDFYKNRNVLDSGNNQHSPDEERVNEIESLDKSWRNDISSFLSRKLMPRNHRLSIAFEELKDNDYITMDRYIDAIKSLEWAENRIIQLLKENDELKEKLISTIPSK